MKPFLLLIIAAFYIVSVVYSHSIQWLPLWFMVFFIACNIISFIFYGIDKLAAIKYWQRTPEKHFYVLALLGGWPGSILGQIVFNHKTSKISFRRWFYIMSSANVVLMTYYLLSLDLHNLIDRFMS